MLKLLGVGDVVVIIDTLVRVTVNVPGTVVAISVVVVEVSVTTVV